MTHEYFISSRWKKSFGQGCLLCVVFLLIISNYEVNFIKESHDLLWASFLGPGSFLLVLGLLLKLIYGIFLEKIVITQNSIEYKAFLVHIKRKWEDLHYIGTQGGFRNIEGLYFKKSKSDYGKVDFIPLSFFSDNWRTSEIGQQIKQYAPHLFEQEIQESAQSA